MRHPITKRRLIDQLKTLGVKSGSVLLVHTAFSRVSPVEGDMLGLVDALETAISPDGTLVMPSMSWDDDNIFDPTSTPCPEMGIVADTFWRQPHVHRSGNAHAFAARGIHAEKITAPHPLDLPHGLGSPVGRVYEFDGQILLLGVDQGSNTTIHLAESLAGVRYRCKSRLQILQDGKPIWFEFDEINHCCQNFEKVDHWLDERGLLSRGTVGYATTRLMNSRDLVDVVVEKLKTNETVFLHPYGVDDECDEARASIPT